MVSKQTKSDYDSQESRKFTQVLFLDKTSVKVVRFAKDIVHESLFMDSIWLVESAVSIVYLSKKWHVSDIELVILSALYVLLLGTIV